MLNPIILHAYKINHSKKSLSYTKMAYSPEQQQDFLEFLALSNVEIHDENTDKHIENSTNTDTQNVKH
jgi:hypothetical protein